MAMMVMKADVDHGHHNGQHDTLVATSPRDQKCLSMLWMAKPV